MIPNICIPRLESASVADMAKWEGDASMANCVETSWRSGDLYQVLAELKVSRSVYFHIRSVARSALNCKSRSQRAQLGMPVWFIKDHGDKFEQWVTLRTRLISKLWRVRLSVSQQPNRSPKITFFGGWPQFAADNRLKQGESLVFVLSVDARSEFQVYIFRRTGRYFSISQTPARKLANNDDEENVSEQREKTDSYAGRQTLSAVEGSITKTGDFFIAGKKKAVQERHQALGDGSSESDDDGQAPSPVHHIQERQCSAALTGCGSEQSSGAAPEVLAASERKSFASQNGTNSLPSFRRRLIASDLSRGHIEIPTRFVRAHLSHLQDDVALQGIHQESPVRIVTCHWIRNCEQWVRIYFRTGWRRFVEENGLQAGQELHLTLISDSFFVVRVV